MNKEIFDFLGITEWTEAGYTGKNITIASKEEVIAGVFDDVITIRDAQKDKWTIHGTSVMDIIRQVLPDAKKIAVKTSGTVNKRTGKVKSEGLDYLFENVPDILTTSFFKNTDDDFPMFDKYKELKEKGCFLVCAAGNKQKELEELTKDDVWKAIGACVLDDGKIKLEKCYATGDEMDFVSFHELFSLWDNDIKEGTSYSSPLFASMCGLVQDFFVENTGKKLSHEKLEMFLIDNCIDLDKKGKDVKTGYGLFILPEPTEINIYKYSEVKMFKDYTEWKEAIYYLAEKGEMDSPTMWLERIEYDTDVDLMWFCVKWANAVAKQ